MGKFDSYVGEFTLNVNGTVLEFKQFSVKDKGRFFNAKEDMEKVLAVMSECLKKEYPQEDPQKLDAFLIENSEALLVEMLNKFKLMTPEAYKTYKEGGFAALNFLFEGKKQDRKQ